MPGNYDLKAFSWKVIVLGYEQRGIPCPYFAITRECREYLWGILASLESKGKPIGNNDLWIAAYARAAALKIVTNNEREFQRVPGLKVQNWVGRH